MYIGSRGPVLNERPRKWRGERVRGSAGRWEAEGCEVAEVSQTVSRLLGASESSAEMGLFRSALLSFRGMVVAIGEQ